MLDVRIKITPCKSFEELFFDYILKELSSLVFVSANKNKQRENLCDSSTRAMWFLRFKIFFWKDAEELVFN